MFERQSIPAHMQRSGTMQNSAFERSLKQQYTPSDYYQDAQSEANSSQVKHDALGQRVRDRFNEDVSEGGDFNRRPGSKHLQLKSKILHAHDQQSNMSRSHTSGNRKRAVSTHNGASVKTGKTVSLSEASRLFKRATAFNQPKQEAAPIEEAEPVLQEEVEGVADEECVDNELVDQVEEL